MNENELVDGDNNSAIGKFIQAAGHRTNLHDEGSGAPLVLLHGSGPGVSAWTNWAHVIQPLAKNFRVLAPDIAGFGYTEFNENTHYNIKVWVAHYVGILDALGLEKASIVGNSFGGGLALATALSHPDRIDKLVLLGTPCGEFEMTEGLRSGWFYEPDLENMERILRLFPYDQSSITEEMIRTRYEASARPGAQDAFRKLIPRPADDASTLVKGVPEKLLQRINHPTLVLHGREDQVIPLELGIRLLTNMPNAQLHVFGQCGHWVQVEREKEFVSLVMNFVSGG